MTDSSCVVVTGCRLSVNEQSFVSVFGTELGRVPVARSEITRDVSTSLATAVVSFHSQLVRDQFLSVVSQKYDAGSTMLECVSLGIPANRFRISIERGRNPSPQTFASASLLDDDGVPWDFICPLTLDIMEDPVRTSCGHCFEKELALQWISSHGSCPTCKTETTVATLDPMDILARRIKEFREERERGPAAAPVDNHKVLQELMESYGKTRSGDSSTVELRDTLAMKMHSIAPHVHEKVPIAEWLTSSARPQVLAAVKIADWLGRIDGLSDRVLEAMLAIIARPDPQIHGNFTPYHISWAINSALPTLSPSQKSRVIQVMNSFHPHDHDLQFWKQKLMKNLRDS